MRYNEFADDRKRKAEILTSAVQKYAEQFNFNVEFNYPAFHAPEIEITDFFAETTPGQGVGTNVMKLIISLADVYHFNLYVGPDTPRNKAFYERFGFEVSRSKFNKMIRYCSVEDEEDEEFS